MFNYSNIGDYRERCPCCGTLCYAEIPFFPLRLVGRVGWSLGIVNLEQDPVVDFVGIWGIGILLFAVFLLQKAI